MSETIIWRNFQGEIHRDGDLPAVIYPNGVKKWYQNGELHRDGDQPAIICDNGSKYWYKKGIEYKSIILDKTVLLEEKNASLEKELQNLKDSIKQILLNV